MKTSSLFSTILLAATLSCESALEPSTIERDARVTEVEIQILESFPVQVRAVVRGELEDGCTRVSSVEPSREGNEFRIRLRTTRPEDALCTQAIVPFEETVPLDVLGLPAGTYRVVANGVEASFTLEVDNSR